MCKVNLDVFSQMAPQLLVEFSVDSTTEYRLDENIIAVVAVWCLVTHWDPLQDPWKHTLKRTRWTALGHHTRSFFGSSSFQVCGPILTNGTQITAHQRQLLRNLGSSTIHAG